VITARDTRLIRASDPAAFRRAIASLAGGLTALEAADTFVLVPTRSAAEQLRRTCEALLLDARRPALALPRLGTRADLYDTLHQRLPVPPRRLTAFEREVMLAAAAREAAAAGVGPPFTLRPGLVAEILQLYDACRRQLRPVDRFERALVEELERDADTDRGAARMLQQTRFLAATFRGYESRVAAGPAVDEHALGDLLRTAEPARPMRRLIVTVADRAAEAQGLWLSDFDLLARLPMLARLDLVATEAMLASGYLERLHDHLPGIVEERAAPADRARPVLQVPAAGSLVFTSRDREEELAGVARRLKAARRAGRPRRLARTALVVHRPLPYLYLADSSLAGAGVPFETFETLPLAAEPFAAALDLLFDCVASGFTRVAVVSLLRSPHFAFGEGGHPVPPAALTALDRALAAARYLGDRDRLAVLAGEWSGGPSHRHRELAPAAAALSALLPRLGALADTRPLTSHLRDLVRLVDDHEPPAGSWPVDDDRHLRVRAAVLSALEALADAYAHHDASASGTLWDLAPAIRRWLGGQTFAPRARRGGIQLVDAPAAPYGEFDEVQLLGVIEGEWPERERRSIFYPAALLRNLAWPDEQARLSAARAAFTDLLHLPRERLLLSTFTLEDDGIVEPSSLLEELQAQGLPQEVQPADLSARVFTWEALALPPPRPDVLSPPADAWARFRIDRREAGTLDDRFRGEAGPWTLPRASVSRVERYLECPFRFFAAEVLRLEEDLEDEGTRTPLERGRFLHELFERFYAEWARRGGGQITPVTIGDANHLFDEVAERALAGLPAAEAVLERPRLLGSGVGPGMGHRVLAMEAERPAKIRERLLEFPLDGQFRFVGADGAPRDVMLRGKADRIDLLEDGTFRVVDYKTRQVPNPRKALQLPIYGLCAAAALSGREGREWRLVEACYVSLEGARTVVSLPARPDALAAVLASAEVRLIGALGDIAAGHFPPRPVDRRLCAVCAYASVCRKDYVDEEGADPADDEAQDG
jgi:RecB family exonuclease